MTQERYNSAYKPSHTERLQWVDYAKGICIIFVVMLHSTLGVEKAAEQQGWMHYVVDWAQPFRMPDFFLIAGLFLARVIDRNWRDYLDKKLFHFVYFYILWTIIQFGIKIPTNAAQYGWENLPFLYLKTFFVPYSTLWFIYMLPIMFIVTKLVKHINWKIVLLGAAILEVAPIHTGVLIIDEFAARYVYFLIGYLCAEHIFTIANWVSENRKASIYGLIAWGTLNAFGVSLGMASWPVLSLIFGISGALAVTAAASLLATQSWTRIIAFCGKHSIVIYLAFFFPMAITRMILLKIGVINDIGTISLIVTLSAVAAPLILMMIINKFNIGHFLFERPQWANMSTKNAQSTQRISPAE